MRGKPLLAPSSVDADAVFAQIGEFGPQQVKYLLALSLFRMFEATTYNAYIFVKTTPPFECTVSEGGFVRDQCVNQETSQCASISFNTTTSTSIVSEWGLVCEREWLVPLTFSARLFGAIASTFITGFLSDMLGRKFVMVFCLIAHMISNQMGALSPWFIPYIICQFLSGLASLEVPASVLVNEIITGPKKNLGVVLYSNGWSVGLMLLPAFALFLKDWRHLYTVLTLSAIIPLVCLLYIPESPRWLLTKGREEEAFVVLRKIAKKNNKVCPLVEKTDYDACPKTVTSEGGKPAANLGVGEDPTVEAPAAAATAPGLSFLDLFKHCYTILLILALTFIWSTVMFLYVGLTLLAGGEDSANIYIGTALIGLVDFPGDLLGVLFVHLLGKRTILFLGFLLKVPGTNVLPEANSTVNKKIIGRQ